MRVIYKLGLLNEGNKQAGVVLRSIFTNIQKCSRLFAKILLSTAPACLFPLFNNSSLYLTRTIPRCVFIYPCFSLNCPPARATTDTYLSQQGQVAIIFISGYPGKFSQLLTTHGRHVRQVTRTNISQLHALIRAYTRGPFCG